MVVPMLAPMTMGTALATGRAVAPPLPTMPTIMEVVAVMLSVGAVSLLIHDGRTNWFEGLQLLAIYAILAVAFYYLG